MWKNLATYVVNGGHEIQIRMQPSELVLFTPGLNRDNGLQPWSPQHTVVECVCIPRVGAQRLRVIQEEHRELSISIF